MLWSDVAAFHEEPFDLESELEEAILQVSEALFGNNRIYIDTKKKIGAKGKTQNIPEELKGSCRDSSHSVLDTSHLFEGYYHYSWLECYQCQ